jgi:hypothetical protein
MSLQLMTKFFKPTEKIQSQSENVTNLNNEVMIILEKEKTPTDHIKNRKEGNPESVEFGQPIIDFPLTFIDGQNRKFNAEWYKRYSWLRYDIASDSAFCGVCLDSKTVSKNNNKTNFTDIGFSNWKNALKKFNKHQDSQSHSDNLIFWLNKKDVTKPSCATLINSQHQKNVELNRRNLMKIIETVHLIAKQGLAFRGHDESLTSNNRGNFQEILKHMSKYDEELAFHLKNKNSNYTCSDSQNEILSLLAGHIRTKMLPASDQFFALIANETMDLSKVEQVCVCLRYVQQDFTIQERFFGFYNTGIVTADAIFDLLKRVLESLQLDLNLMVGQSYDGAATMSGLKNGVASKFLKIAKSAVYVHCHAHKLNLALCDASMQIDDVSDVIDIVESVSVFVKRSAKRHALFEHIKDDSKKERLKLFSATRWESRYASIKAFVSSFEYLITFLDVSIFLSVQRLK